MSRRIRQTRPIRYAQPMLNVPYLPYGQYIPDEPVEPPLPNYPATGTMPTFEKLRTLKMISEKRPETISNLKYVHPSLHPNADANIKAAMYYEDEQSMYNLLYPGNSAKNSGRPTPTHETLSEIEIHICTRHKNIHPSNAYKLFEMLLNEYFLEHIRHKPSQFIQQLNKIIECVNKADLEYRQTIRSPVTGNTVLHLLADAYYIPKDVRKRLSEPYLFPSVVNATNMKGFTPLDVAITSMDEEFIRFLLDNGATVSTNTILEAIVSAIEKHASSLDENTFRTKLQSLVDLVLPHTVDLRQQFPINYNGHVVTLNIVEHIGAIRGGGDDDIQFVNNIRFAIQLLQQIMERQQQAGGKRSKRIKTRHAKQTKRAKCVARTRRHKRRN